jgi:site-specific recombinase XerD
MPTANPKTTTLDLDVLTTNEVRALMDACSRRAPTGIRNRALIALLYGAGLRISEALALLPKDLDLDALAVRVHRGKGAKARTAALLPEAVPYLERWLDKRKSLGVNGRRPVFCTLQAGPIATPYIRVLLPRLARKAGIEKRVHAHGLRHSHAHKLRREGVDVAQIQKQLGHASLATTGVYLDHLGAHELPEMMRAQSWGL